MGNKRIPCTPKSHKVLRGDTIKTFTADKRLPLKRPNCLILELSRNTTRRLIRFIRRLFVGHTHNATWLQSRIFHQNISIFPAYSCRLFITFLYFFAEFNHLVLRFIDHAIFANLYYFSNLIFQYLKKNIII